MQEQTMNILVVGATGGSGHATVEELLNAGHRVTAFSRHADKLAGLSDRLHTVNGDATDPDDIDDAVPGHDAVVVTLGITENALRVRLFGAVATPMDVRSAGTRNVIATTAAPRRATPGRAKIVWRGHTRDRLRWVDRLFFTLLLKSQIEDTEAQEQTVRESGLEWVIAQPVHLTDDASATPALASPQGTRRRGASRAGLPPASCDRRSRSAPTSATPSPSRRVERADPWQDHSVG